MIRSIFGAGCTLLILAQGAAALEAVGTLKKIDADKGIVIVFANGQDRTLTADKNLKLVDEQGKTVHMTLRTILPRGPSGDDELGDQHLDGLARLVSGFAADGGDAAVGARA